MLCSLSDLPKTERFTGLHGEEKREEGVRGDPNEMRLINHPFAETVTALLIGYTLVQNKKFKQKKSM